MSEIVVVVVVVLVVVVVMVVFMVVVVVVVIQQLPYYCCYNMLHTAIAKVCIRSIVLKMYNLFVFYLCSTIINGIHTSKC